MIDDEIFGLSPFNKSIVNKDRTPSPSNLKSLRDFPSLFQEKQELHELERVNLSHKAQEMKKLRQQTKGRFIDSLQTALKD